MKTELYKKLRKRFYWEFCYDVNLENGNKRYYWLLYDNKLDKIKEYYWFDRFNVIYYMMKKIKLKRTFIKLDRNHTKRKDMNKMKSIKKQYAKYFEK